MEFLRDDYLRYLQGDWTGRPMFVELFGPLVGLEDEWRAQGASEAEINLTAFGFDFVRRHHVGIATGALGGEPERVLEDNAERRVFTDRFGRRQMLLKATATIPLPVEYPVRTMDDWRRWRHLYTWSDARPAPGWAAAARMARENGALIFTHVPGAYSELRDLLGEEELSIAYYEQPELVHEVLDTIATTAERVLAMIGREVRIDQLSVYEDFAGRSGPLVGPRQLEEFMAPYYRRVWAAAQAAGARVFQLDSDGNFEALLPGLLAAGLNSFEPMEPAAGMDIVALRQRFGRGFSTLGGIDKHVLRRSRAEIDAELDYKLQPALRTGGAVFGLDHRIPNGTPLESYRYYVRRAREILGLDPNPPPGWARMAF